jgi:hypothetical protein
MYRSQPDAIFGIKGHVAWMFNKISIRSMAAFKAINQLAHAFDQRPVGNHTITR